MCGIAGIISHQKNFDIKHWLYQSSKILQHRGNDDDGVTIFDQNNVFYCSKIEHPLSQHNQLKYLQQIPFEQVSNNALKSGLLHRRLSIIDLSEYGHQPMCDESCKVWITYNGEIYNYIELKKNLQDQGIKFFSNSDTEVILKSYLQYGKNFIQHLNGMWAFCIVDLRSNQIILSRDRIGVKPLYYTKSKFFFAFASEQKVFLKTGLIDFELNHSAAANYLIDNLLENEEEGIFKNIFEVLPGENIYISISDLQIKKERYFHLDQLPSDSKKMDEQYAIQTTKTLVDKSIYEHLRSDVEVAVSLSGGIDSTVIAMNASKHLKSFHTFSIVYPQNKKIDESYYVQIVNNQINSHPHYITPTEESFFDELNELLYAQDIPIWSTSTYNQFVLMRNVHKNGIKVILSGQGSDELFAGYQHHYVAYWLSLIKKFKLLSFFQHIENSKSHIFNPYVLLLKSYIKNVYNYKLSIAKKYLSNEWTSAYKDENEHYISNGLNKELLKDLTYRRLKAFLKCEDRCSMWYGVESRLPFSDDIHLLEWAFQIPESLKLKSGISKYELREAFKDILPQKIYNRKDKKGFDAPLSEWLIPKQKDILSEIKNNCKEEINVSNVKQIKNIETLNNNELQMIFKLFLLNRWKKLW